MSFFEYLSKNSAYLITILVTITVIVIACILKVYIMKLNFSRNKKRKNFDKSDVEMDKNSTLDTNDKENKVQ